MNKMKCSRCKKDVYNLYTSCNNKLICEDCLKEEIYKDRKRIIKKNRKNDKMDYLLIGIYIGFGISYATLMILMIIKLIVR